MFLLILKRIPFGLLSSFESGEVIKMQQPQKESNSVMMGSSQKESAPITLQPPNESPSILGDLTNCTIGNLTINMNP